MCDKSTDDKHLTYNDMEINCLRCLKLIGLARRCGGINNLYRDVLSSLDKFQPINKNEFARCKPKILKNKVSTSKYKNTHLFGVDER